MRVYIPVYRNGEKQCEELNHTELRNFTQKSVCRWKEKVGFYGEIYNDNLFLQKEAVSRYWRMEPVRSYTLQELLEAIEAEEREDEEEEWYRSHTDPMTYNGVSWSDFF